MKKDINSYNLKAVYYVLFICIAIFALAVSGKITHHKSGEKVVYHKSKKVSRKVRVETLKVKMDVDTGSFQGLEDKIQVVDAESAVLKKVEFESDSIFYAQKKAQYLERLTIGKDEKASRSDLVIRYYKKSVDEKNVYALRELGFYIHERSSDDELDSVGSNIIHYGDSATREDILLVAYTLIVSGLEIREISESKFHDAWKAQSIEIGTDTTILEKDIITLSQLRKDWGVE